MKSDRKCYGKTITMAVKVDQLLKERLLKENEINDILDTVAMKEPGISVKNYL